MKRVVVLLSLLAGCPDGSCYILSGDVACENDDDCPSDVPFCVDRVIESDLQDVLAGHRICAAIGNAACTTSGDCVGSEDGNIFCTQDPDGNRFCTSFCDDENQCLEEQGERCVEGGCVFAECVDDGDCSEGECFADQNLNLGCVPAGAGCGPVDDVACLADDFLCESSVYGRCMPPQEAVGSCDLASSLSEPGGMMMFINEAPSIPCTGGSACFRIAAVVIRPQGSPVSAVDFASAADVFVAFQDDVGNVEAEAITVGVRAVDPAADADRAAIEFDVEGSIAPVVLAVQLLQTDVDLTNTACFTP